MIENYSIDRTVITKRLSTLAIVKNLIPSGLNLPKSPMWIGSNKFLKEISNRGSLGIESAEEAYVLFRNAQNKKLNKK